MADISEDKDVYEKAKEKFETEFKFSNMDTMMHRFPPAIRDEMNKKYPYMVEPRLVAIGSYHHGKKHLEKMEEVKNAAAYYICDRVGVEPEMAMEKVLYVVREARGKYYLDDATTVDLDDTNFAAMMFRDACFLLLYMDVYDRSYGEEEDYVVNKSMRRFLFSNRDSIESDIMLLENQIPWRVIQALDDLAKEDISQAVEKFITGMGNSFKITESFGDDSPATYDELNDKVNPPAHLLEVLRRHKTKSVRQLARPWWAKIKAMSPMGLEEIEAQQLKRPWAKIKAMSPMGLEEIGINLTPSKTAAFSDVYFLKGPFGFSRDLSLPPLFLNDTVASCLLNMVALEVCTASRFGDHPDKTAVCSYVALLAFFMIGDEDVRRLRSMHLLEGPHSHDYMCTFFTTVANHLTYRGVNFYNLMGQINEYRSKSYRIAIYSWLYNNYLTIIKLVSVIGTIIGVFKALLSVAHKN